MKILVLIHEYPPIGGGGGQAAQDICEGLVREGHEVRVLTSHFSNLPVSSDINGVLVERLLVNRKEAFKAGFNSMLSFVIKAIFRGRKVIRKWKPDVLHAHFAVPAGAASFILSVLTGIPYVLTAHLGDVPGGVPEKTSGWFHWVFPFTPPIWKKAKKVIAVSDFTRGLALKHYAVDVEVIPNGVDLVKLDPGKIIVNNPPVVVFAGRIVTQKNPQLFIETLTSIRDLPWECVMIGDGVLKEEVIRQAEEYGIEKRITFTGWINPDEVIEWYRKSDILFMPSRSEGLPLVGVQALSMGLALVMSDVGGNAELITNGKNGFLYESMNREGFQSGLYELLNNSKKLLSFRLESRKKASKLDICSVVKSYEVIFSTIKQQ